MTKLSKIDKQVDVERMIDESSSILEVTPQNADAILTAFTRRATAPKKPSRKITQKR
jgi:hypothetical protein